MRIIGCDLHARQQSVAMLDTETGEVVNRTLMHDGNEVRELSAPNLALVDRRKPKPPSSHSNTTFPTQIYIRWCCIDLSNAPRLPVTWVLVSTSPATAFIQAVAMFTFHSAPMTDSHLRLLLLSTSRVGLTANPC